MKLNFTVREIAAAVVFVFILFGSLLPLSGNTGAGNDDAEKTQLQTETLEVIDSNDQ